MHKYGDNNEHFMCFFSPHYSNYSTSEKISKMLNHDHIVQRKMFVLLIAGMIPLELSRAGKIKKESVRERER